jgi:hypothetical protein
VLTIDIGGDAPGSGYDQLLISGSATLDGALNVSLLSGFVLTSTEMFPIMTLASLSGAFCKTTNLDPAFMDSPLYDPMDVTLVAPHPPRTPPVPLTAHSPNAQPGVGRISFYRLAGRTRMATNTKNELRPLVRRGKVSFFCG